ncbi:hypothetical protein Kpol_1058p35 [Vanderwaltozyma polyspora DSM 70294]|uniref:DNA mismatch repair proteins mutS family domain-containing protein n=1 Tax=Vanderwaltozyma polyspora (strain ATCC 22028 / DSM 70294 / BCRC 21397 / CBS 2163 / NBRC 10782 / NRRL Y-8283 / UCD 57-17) TaxID=436907 RepID=A7TJR9_VANPO|nr:uncharacterized protein Kpol_1058p35 [Vanderwaltozyma polyspora DSM 70294]EDO17498.1 hypothetical protein Kpol_1058p35 [Vanderwaltozyma polyspora DSM 70294]
MNSGNNSDSNLSSFINARLFEESNSAATTSPSTGTSRTNSISRRILKSKPKSKPRCTVASSRKDGKVSTRRVTTSRRSNARSKCCPTTNQVSSYYSTEKIIFTVFESSKNMTTRIGICIINYNTGELIMSEYLDSQIFIRTIHKLQIYQPTDIFLPNSSLNPVVSKLATIIKFNISDSVKVHEVPINLFNLKEGILILNKYSIIETDVKEEYLEKKFALMAISAAIKKVSLLDSNDICNKFHKFRIKYENSENTMVIDSKSISSLELISNKFDPNGLSLLKYLDSTSTKMGSRSLRNNILQPLTDRENIELRLKSITELLSLEDGAVDEIRKEMKSFQDLDKLFSKLLSINQIAIKPEQKINYVISLKDSIATSQKIQKILNRQKFESRLLIEIKEILNNNMLDQIKNDINKYINEDCSWASSNLELQNQRSYAVKSGANGLLDLSRKMYKNLTNEIVTVIEDIGIEYDLDVIQSYDSNKGFYIKLKKNTLGDMNNLPKILTNVTLKNKYYECTTSNLIKLNLRLKEMMSEILIISEQVVQGLFSKIMKNICILFMISEAISILDLLCCFANKSHKFSYCIPKFSNKLFVTNSRHPILDITVKNFVRNDISSSPSSHLQIVTGCNMSGKSVYLRQVVLLCIMAQIGCPVPAESAYFPIYTKIHARINNDTDELTSSTFTFEMKEISQFLQDLTPSTLLIIDELGRGSSIGDGLAISLAITEYLLQSPANIFISTHFHDIVNIFQNKPSVSHITMGTQSLENNTLKMLFKASSNHSIIKNSGLKAVQKFFNPEIIKSAFLISNSLNTDRLNSVKKSLTEEERLINEKTLNQMKRINNLVGLLEEIINSPEPINLETLRQLQTKFINSF